MLCLTLPLSIKIKFTNQTLLLRPKTPFLPLNFTPNRHNFVASKNRRVRASCNCIVEPSHSSSEDDFDVELGRLLALLPEEMRRRLSEHLELHQLIEVVMDLGRKPLARFPSGDFVLSDCPIQLEDIAHATSQVGDFALDNRAGISRTLHRISAIRNRKGNIIGLTCRVGRAISGSAPLLQDLVQDGASLLLIGPPGVGKTTIIREIARMLANDYQKRVMIVDTSNEIGGDGDIPHAGIGNARRMQVPDSDVQHKVLIEAVENHMPQVIVIDEIGTKLEAMAASTIAQRGIQLVATAHGNTIENLIMNPALEMLVGGIQSVTLGDEEASRRGVQKTVLERKGPSTFSCGVEIVSKTELRVHRSLEATVDAILSGVLSSLLGKEFLCYSLLKTALSCLYDGPHLHSDPFCCIGWLPNVEVRKMGCKDPKETVGMEPLPDSFSPSVGMELDKAIDIDGKNIGYDDVIDFPKGGSGKEEASISLYAYGILEASIIQGIKQLKLEEDAIQLTDNLSEADAILALQSKLKKNPKIQAAARTHGIPTYVTKTSSLVQITKALRSLMRDLENLEDSESDDNMKLSEKMDALEEARMAIEQFVIPKGEAVELLPRSPNIIRLQMDLIKEYQLRSERVGKEPDICLRILPFHAALSEDNDTGETDEATGFDDFLSSNSNGNGYIYSISRLPLLPE